MTHSMIVDHVSIAVRDIDRALAFFGSFLPIEINVAKRAGYTPDFNWTDFYVGDFKLELIEPAAAGSFVRKFIDRRGEGLHHLSLDTDEFDALLSRLERDGVRVVDRWKGTDGGRTAFISPRSAHGLLIQFWESKNLDHPARPPYGTVRLRSGESIKVRIDHVSYAVRSIETALAFFQRYFPVRLGVEKHMGYDGRFWLMPFWMQGYKMELLEETPEQAGGFVTRFIEKRGEGFHHLSVDVDRLDPLLDQLKAGGTRIVDEADLGGGYKTAFISPRSAHGVLIQFWQNEEAFSAA